MQKSIKIVLLIFAIATCHAKAQNVTDSQRQNAVNTATRFCELLSQFSSGKGQYLSNDELIIKLCSSSKISAYDDIVEDREDILATYLINITHDYCNDLPMTFTKPVVESVFGLPEFARLYKGYNLQLEISDYSDIYIIMSCTQRIPSLNKSTIRKIIYSCSEDKIISFSNSNSPFISAQKGIIAYTQHDYETALIHLDAAIKSRRFDYKETCYSLATGCCFLLNDTERLIYYSSKLKNQGYANYINGVIFIRNGDYLNGIQHYEKALKYGYEDAYYVLGIIYSSTEMGHLNVSKAKEYFMKAINSNERNVKSSGAYFYSIMALNGPQEMKLSRAQLIEYMKIASENGYVMAYIPLAILYEQDNDIFNAAIWASCAVEDCPAHAAVARAMLGRFYLTSSQAETVSKGIELLKKALELNSIDNELDAIAEQTGLEPKFPTSNEDVKQLLQKYNQ